MLNVALTSNHKVSKMHQQFLLLPSANDSVGFEMITETQNKTALVQNQPHEVFYICRLCFVLTCDRKTLRNGGILIDFFVVMFYRGWLML